MRSQRAWRLPSIPYAKNAKIAKRRKNPFKIQFLFLEIVNYTPYTILYQFNVEIDE